jgi:photosystem II stability/assembly factor-like uncharacterized protein
MAQQQHLDHKQPAAGGGLVGMVISALPWLIIGGLLWAGVFIKPKPVGSTVEPPVVEHGDAFFGMAASDGGQLWAAGNDGKMIHSADGGATWTKQRLDSTLHLQDIAAWDGQRLLAVGNGGSIFVSTDGGGNWTARRPGFLPATNDKLLRVKAYAEGKAWAVGEMGALLFSGDDGNTWERRRDEQDTAFNDVAMVGDVAGWVVGEAGLMLNSRDGGQTWTALPQMVSSSLMAIAFRDAENGVAVGLEGVILVTRDGGKTWTRTAASDAGTRNEVKLHFYDVAWDAAGSRWLVVGAQGSYVTSDADAATWTAGQLSPHEFAWHTRIVAGKAGFYLAGASLGEWSGSADGWRQLVADQ